MFVFVFVLGFVFVLDKEVNDNISFEDELIIELEIFIFESFVLNISCFNFLIVFCRLVIWSFIF